MEATVRIHIVRHQETAVRRRGHTVLHQGIQAEVQLLPVEAVEAAAAVEDDPDN